MSNNERENLNELESLKGDINSTNNQRQMNARERIARNAEFLSAKEHQDQGMDFTPDDGIPDDDLEGGVSDSYQVTDDTLKVDLRTQPKQHLEPEKPRLFKVKINGQDAELTEAELIERAQKVEAADRYLAEKKREADLLLAEARLRLEQPSVQPTDAATEPENDYLEAVRQLQVGDEHTAAKVLKDLIDKAKQPAIREDVVAAKVRDDLDLASATKWFHTEFKDIASDPNLMTLAMARDAELRKIALSEKKVSTYMDRYRQIGEELRTWKGTSPEFSEKVERKKQTLKNVPQASVKNASLVEDDDNLSEEEYHQKAIQETARRRYQTHLGG